MSEGVSGLVRKPMLRIQTYQHVAENPPPAPPMTSSPRPTFAGDARAHGCASGWAESLIEG